MDNTDKRHIIKEAERQKILDDVKLGLWRIELKNGQPPKMYGDHNMYEVLGADPQRQPEELYAHWHERIAPAYRSYVDKAVERLIQTGQHVEVEYIWYHPKKGKTIVRCDATLTVSQEGSETAMLGTHRDITNKLVSTSWNETGYKILDYYKMNLCGKYLIRAYEDLFLVDLDTKAIHMVAYRHDHCSAVQDGVSVFSIIEKCVPPEDQELVASLFSDETVQTIIATNSSRSVDFRRGIRCGKITWVRGTLYATQINGIHELLFVVQDIENEHKLQVLTEEKEDLLYSVIHERSVIYEFDTVSRRLQILKPDIHNINQSVASANLSLQELVRRLCTHYVDPSEWSKLRTFFSFENIRRCAEGNHKHFLSLALDASDYQYNYVKFFILPSSKTRTRAYLVLELMDQTERLYPILESFFQSSADYFYYIDLKKGHFFQLIGNAEAYPMPPKEGHNYTQAIQEFIDEHIVEEEQELSKQQLSPDHILKALAVSKEFSFAETVRGEDGQILKKLLKYSLFDLEKGLVLMQRTDITDQYNRETMLKKAQRDSITDPLTQLYNRLGSEQLIREALEKTDSTQTAALIMLDLDSFKEVNDRFGHPTGDQVLQEVARRLTTCFRSRDIVGRLGGDEFIIFLRKMNSRIDIHHILNRVVQTLNIVCEDEAGSITITPSLGATFCMGQPYEELYKQADIALYHSKKQKNRYSLFDDVM